MEITTEWLSTEQAGTTLRAYCARPAAATGKLPGVLVIQEIWGADAHILDMTRRFAEAGYLALAPDLYFRGQRSAGLDAGRIEEVKAHLDRVGTAVWHDQEALQRSLAALDPALGQRVGETLGLLFGPKDTNTMEDDLVAWLDHMLRERDCPKVGSVGYCMGGGLSFALACKDPRLSAALVYYGSTPVRSRLQGVGCPVYGFYGETDARITSGVADTEAAMRELGKQYEAVVYKGAGHAFFNDTRASYEVGAARRAWARTLHVLARQLDG